MIDLKGFFTENSKKILRQHNIYALYVYKYIIPYLGLLGLFYIIGYISV